MRAQEKIHIGDLYGRLKVINLPYKVKNRWYVECECTCNKKTKLIVNTYNLVSGRKKSCGCLVRETASKKMKQLHKTNIYNLEGEFGIGYCPNIDPTDSEHIRNYFYFDLEDYDKIKKYRWRFDKDGYVYTFSCLEEGKKNIRMHRLVMDCPPNKVIDHIKHNNYDNRKKELRICNQSQNNSNRKNKKNKIATGICQTKYNTWRVSLVKNKKTVLNKSFKTLEEAITARKEAEDKYFGEYSYDNSMSMDTENKETIDI